MESSSKMRENDTLEAGNLMLWSKVALCSQGRQENDWGVGWADHQGAEIFRRSITERRPFGTHLALEREVGRNIFWKITLSGILWSPQRYFRVPTQCWERSAMCESAPASSSHTVLLGTSMWKVNHYVGMGNGCLHKITHFTSIFWTLAPLYGP